LALPSSAFVSPHHLCPGTCTDFINLSHYATNYQWNFFGAYPDTSTTTNPTSICYANPGSYDVQLIASNANGSDTLTLSNYITVYPTPPPQSITQNGDTLFAVAGASAYQWYFNGTSINGATYYFYVAHQSGDYNVVATDANGCEVEAAVFNVIASLSTSAISPHFSIFPNPVAERLGIISSEFGVTTINISIYNLVGLLVVRSRTNPVNYRAKNSEISMDVSALAKGMYWIEVSNGQKSFRIKFVKE
jgi:PKD repeat protein